MRRALGPLLTTLLLTTGLASGCGAGGADTATDPATEPSSGSPGGVDFTTIDVIGQSAGGGRVDQRATVLDDDAAVAAFSKQFRADAFAHRIEAAIGKADVGAGRTVVGAVVSIGCDVPPGVRVHRTGSGLELVPLKVPHPMQECFAPVTSVALVAVDSDAV